MHKKYIIKFGFGNWTIEIGPIKNKLKDKNYRGHGKSCPRMENHAKSMPHFLCHMHDILFLGMICRFAMPKNGKSCKKHATFPVPYA
jgi:hypothetical protein